MTTGRALVGLGFVGYGLLVLLGVIAHESPWVGTLSLVAGGALLSFGLPRIEVRRGRLVAALGAAIVVGVAGYNLLARSDLGGPEWGLLAYGTALFGAAFALDQSVGRVNVGTLVVWSFPLILAPMAVFALNASVSAVGPGGGTAADPFVHALVVVPSAWFLVATGTPVHVNGNEFILATPRGTMVLDVGFVCAGLYPMVLFAALVAVHAWHRNLGRRRLAVYLAVGLSALWFLNLLRIAILTRIGIVYGGDALRTTHEHLGWVLFALFIVAFWGIVLRRFETPPAAAEAAPAP